MRAREPTENSPRSSGTSPNPTSRSQLSVPPITQNNPVLLKKILMSASENILYLKSLEYNELTPHIFLKLSKEPKWKEAEKEFFLA
jgi:hypothetical protein